MKYLVAFVGNEGHLASSKPGGNTVSIWLPPPTVESHIVWKPMFTIDIQGSITRLLFGIILYAQQAAHDTAILTAPTVSDHIDLWCYSAQIYTH